MNDTLNADDRGRVEEMAARVMELDKQETGGRFDKIWYRLNALAHAAPLLAAEVTRLTKELAAEHERAEVLQSQVDNADINLEQVKLIQKGIWKSKVESAEARIAELEKQLKVAHTITPQP